MSRRVVRRNWVLMISAVVGVLLSAGAAHAARPTVWEIDQEGVATCDLEGAPLGVRPLDMHGQRVLVEVQLPDQRDADWKLELGWPILRNPSDLRGGLVRIDRSDLPRPVVNGAAFALPARQRYCYNSVLTIFYQQKDGVTLKCEIFPSTTLRAAVEHWSLSNWTGKPIVVEVASSRKTLSEPTDAMDKPCVLERSVVGVEKKEIAAESGVNWTVLYTLRGRDEAPLQVDYVKERSARRALLTTAGKAMHLYTPERILDGTFTLAKMRLLEAPVESEQGIIQGTGTKNYLGGVWANDNVEYAAPPCPLLGDATLNASCDAMFRIWLNSKMSTISPSFESYRLTPIGNDRGDQAMMLYGLANYLLVLGDAQRAQQMWPLVEKSVKLTKEATRDNGVVASRSDELEGRYPTGTANLSSSSLAYGGYVAAANLAQSLGKTQEADDYRKSAAAVRKGIESHFGADVEGFHTYRYFEGCTVLRGWASLPLAMGIYDRKDGTLAALFSDKLWFEDAKRASAGTKVASNDPGCGWPRETWYALRGAFKAGAADLAFEKTLAAVKAGMLGPEGPYLDEDGGDLLSPSALYLLVVSEGLFGIEPKSLDSFTCTPHMPTNWPAMDLRNVCMMGRVVDLAVERDKAKIRLTVTHHGKPVLSESRDVGKPFEVDLSKIAR